MLVGIPIALLLAGAGGLWLASIGLRPITEMAQRAARIPLTGIEDLGQADRTDELGQLARAFNGLVARLRAALQTQRQFMADASHELRTPVSVVRAAADVTLSREHRDEAEYREALAIVGESVAASGPTRRRHAGARARRRRRLSASAGRSLSRRGGRRVPARRRRARDRARRHDSTRAAGRTCRFAATRICCGGWW